MNPKQLVGLDRLAVEVQMVARLARFALSTRPRSAPRPRSATSRRWRKQLKSAGALRRALVDKKYTRFGEHVFFDAFSPRFPGRAFDQVIGSAIGGRAAINSGLLPYVILAITDRCMYRCEHCYAKEVLGGRDSLSLDQLKELVDRFQQQPAGVIAFEGGEPLLRFEDLLRLCEHARAQSEVWIATTGWALTPTKASLLAEAGLIGATISLDHYEPDKHNKFRGNKKAFDEAAKAIALFTQAGVFPALSACATRDVVQGDGMMRYLELAHKLGAGVVQFLDPVPTGAYLGQDISLSVDELRAMQRFQREVNTLPRHRHLPAVSTRASLEDDHTFGCGAGGNAILYVDPAGNLQPCPFLSLSTGNLVTDGFDRVLERMRQLFPRPAAVGVRCPATTLGGEIAEARGRCERLPLPYEETRHICRGFASKPLPDVFDS